MIIKNNFISRSLSHQHYRYNNKKNERSLNRSNETWRKMKCWHWKNTVRYDFFWFSVLFIFLVINAYASVHAYARSTSKYIKINGHQINYAFRSFFLSQQVFHYVECAVTSTVAHVKYETNMWWCMLKMHGKRLYILDASIRLKTFQCFFLMLWDNNLY